MLPVLHSPATDKWTVEPVTNVPTINKPNTSVKRSLFQEKDLCSSGNSFIYFILFLLLQFKS